MHNCVEQAVYAEQMGFDRVWAVEHHSLVEYSHMPAPEIFLSAVAAKTTRIRVGHARGVHAIRVQPPDPGRGASGHARRVLRRPARPRCRTWGDRARAVVVRGQSRGHRAPGRRGAQDHRQRAGEASTSAGTARLIKIEAPDGPAGPHGPAPAGADARIRHCSSPAAAPRQFAPPPDTASARSCSASTVPRPWPTRASMFDEERGQLRDADQVSPGYLNDEFVALCPTVLSEDPEEGLRRGPGAAVLRRGDPALVWPPGCRRRRTEHGEGRQRRVHASAGEAVEVEVQLLPPQHGEDRPSGTRATSRDGSGASSIHSAGVDKAIAYVEQLIDGGVTDVMCMIQMGTLTPGTVHGDHPPLGRAGHPTLQVSTT